MFSALKAPLPSQMHAAHCQYGGAHVHGPGATTLLRCRHHGTTCCHFCREYSAYVEKYLSTAKVSESFQRYINEGLQEVEQRMLEEEGNGENGHGLHHEENGDGAEEMEVEQPGYYAGEGVGAPSG